MLDADFTILHQEIAAELLKAADKQIGSKFLHTVFGRGVRILIDKDKTPAKLITLVSSASKPSPQKPTEQEFLGIVNDFLYHAVFATKHLRRGELW
jgi:aminoglycoside 6-adenylyltransferase